MKQLFMRLILFILISNFSVAMANDSLDVKNNTQTSVSLTNYLGILEDACRRTTSNL